MAMEKVLSDELNTPDYSDRSGDPDKQQGRTAARKKVGNTDLHAAGW